MKTQHDALTEAHELLHPDSRWPSDEATDRAVALCLLDLARSSRAQAHQAVEVARVLQEIANRIYELR